MIHQVKKFFIRKGYIWVLIPQVACWIFALTFGNSLVAMSESRPYFLGGVTVISIGFAIIMIIKIRYGNKQQQTRK